MNKKYLGLCIAALAIAVLWAAAVVMVVLSALPRNPVSLPYVQKIIVKTIVPEGWNFFTRSPREELIYLYKKTPDNQWARVPESINGSQENYFGLTRTARALGSEYGLLFTSNPISWDTCKTQPPLCYESDSTALRVVNKIPQPILCGKYLFVMKPAVPWSWSAHTVEMPGKYLIVDFVCP